MSMLFGLMRLGGPPVGARELSSMSAALGIAGEGDIWVGDAAGLGAGIAGPAADRDAGHTLTRSRDGAAVLVADGHVDDRRELATALGLRPAAALASSPAQLLLAAYERWGEDCLPHVVGEFTFAVWSVRTRRLVLGASAPTARPLYYHVAGDELAFASLARGLFALPRIERRVDEQRIARWLTGVFTGKRRSFFQDVRRLLPGELLAVEGRGHRVIEWWRPDLDRRLQLSGSSEYGEAFDELLRRVIDDQLAGAGPVGIMLSGGLDSGAVAAVAAPSLHRRGLRLSAFAEVPAPGFDGELPRGRYADEGPRVQALADMYPSVDLTLVHDPGRGLLDGVDALFTATEVPFRNAWNRGWIEAIYAQAAAAGVCSLLTGDQGNLTVSWEGRGLFAELCREWRIAALVREARARSRQVDGRSAARIVLGEGIVPLLPAALRSALAARRGPGARRDSPFPRGDSLIAPEFAAEIGVTGEVIGRQLRARAVGEDDHRAVRTRVLLHTGVLGGALHAGYRALYGIDTRMPLADRRLLEFCLAVPEAQYASGDEERLLIRRAMTGRLPAETLRGRERGLQAAGWRARIAGEQPQLLAAVARFEADPLTDRVLDLPRLRVLLEQWPRRAAVDPGLYRGAVGMALMTGAFLLWAQGE